MSDSKLIKFKGREFGVALEWQEFVGKKNVVRNKIKDALKKKKHDGFGVKIEQDKNRVQVGFSNKEIKGVPSLAKFLASKDNFKNSLVLLNFSDDQFWMCSITKAGLIESGSDTLYDREDFISAVSGHITLLDDDESFKVFIAESDADLMESLVGDDVSGFNVNVFNEEEELIGNVKDAEIEQIYNASVDLIKQASTIALLGAVLTSGYFFVYLEDPLYEKIINSDISEAFYDNKSGYEKFVKDQDKKLSNSYETVAKKEILAIHSSAYTNESLYSYIQKLSYVFPIYLVEWELEGITYSGFNKEFFRISYKRIANSYGNTPELKEHIEKIMKRSGITDYSFQTPSTKGDRLFINVKFKNKEETKTGNNVNQFEINKKLKKLEDELELLTASITELEDEVMSFSFMDKRFGSSLEEKEGEILDLVDGTAKIYEDMKEERRKLEIEEVEMDSALISGSRTDVLSMIQSYSYYKWGDAKNSRKFPNIENKAKRKGEEVKVYAKSTALEVGDGGNLDILGLEGLRGVLLNKSLLNKSYIKINEIKFNLQTEEWKIKGEYYEKI